MEADLSKIYFRKCTDPACGYVAAYESDFTPDKLCECLKCGAKCLWIHRSQLLKEQNVESRNDNRPERRRFSGNTAGQIACGSV